MATDNVTFYPVMHLLTGPPGLTRNGGIWKTMKRTLKSIHEPPRLMVQALHFSHYELSQAAWSAWFADTSGSNRLKSELEGTFGGNRDLFIDSGGFQLLNADKLDFSRWNLDVTPDDIFDLQLKYSPQRIASLDSPIPPNASEAVLHKVTDFSIKNAVRLAEMIETVEDPPVPYIVVHGRTPDEIEAYLKRLEKVMPERWWTNRDYGIALGSQVPLASMPERVIENARHTLKWMDNCCEENVPFHMFGIGDNLVGTLAKDLKKPRSLSYDNSTYVQKAFRMRVFDPATLKYRQFNPFQMPECSCAACEKLSKYGADFVSSLMSKMPYIGSKIDGERVNRSDILGLVALHNLYHWRARVDNPRALSKGKVVSVAPTVDAQATDSDYSFPLASFEACSPTLLMLPCSKGRPYGSSRSQTLVKSYLENKGLKESKDYDRITLSGMFGPVHWRHERHPAIMSYDLPLTSTVSKNHVGLLRMKTAMVLNVILRKYAGRVAFLRSRQYKTAFEPVLKSYRVPVAETLDDLIKSFAVD